MLTNLNFLERGKPWPPPSEKERLDTYAANKKLFENKHVEVYRQQLRRIDRVIGNFSGVINYPVILSFQRLMSLKMADLVVGETPSITVPDTSARAGTVDTKRQQAVDRFLLETGLLRKVYSGVIDLSRYGNSLLLLGKENASARPVVKIVPPRPWFPVVNPISIDEVQYHVLAHDWLYDETRNEYRLTVEIHKVEAPGECEKHLYQLDGPPGGWRIGKEVLSKGGANADKLETGLTSCPVFVLSNVQTSDRVFGLDDYDSIDSLVSELIIRVAQVSRVLDKHADPNMTGPASALERDQVTDQWRLRLSNYFPRENKDDPSLEYVTWDGSLDAAFKQIEVLTNQLYSISEMGAALFGDMSNKAGAVPSGSALRRLMISPLAKARRIAFGLDLVLKRLISAGVSLYGVEVQPEEITIKWNDGLPDDELEEVQIMNMRTGGQPTISQYTAIQRLDDMSPEDVESELEQMRVETAGRAPIFTGFDAGAREAPAEEDSG